MTLHEPETPLSADRDIPDTEVIALSAPTPVFVDSTGRRRKVLRRLAYAFGGLCMLYGGLISVNLAGGPVSSSAILPLPDLPLRAAKPAAAKAGPQPAPSVTAPPPTEFAAPLTRRRVDFVRPPNAPHTPTVIPPPTSNRPSSTPSTSGHPLESATTPSSSAPTSPPTSAPTKTPSSQPVPPPSPPSSGTKTGGNTTGGAGGGTGTTTADTTTADTTTGGTTTGGSSGGTTNGTNETTGATTGPTASNTAGTKVDAMGRRGNSRPDPAATGDVTAGDVGRQLSAEIGNDLAGVIGTRIGAILNSEEPA